MPYEFRVVCVASRGVCGWAGRGGHDGGREDCTRLKGGATTKALQRAPESQVFCQGVDTVWCIDVGVKCMLWVAGRPAVGISPPLDDDARVVGERDLVSGALEEHTDLATPWVLAEIFA